MKAKLEYVAPKTVNPAQTEALLDLLKYDDPRKLAKNFSYVFHDLMGRYVLEQYPIRRRHFFVMDELNHFLEALVEATEFPCGGM